ncbi:cation:proton antiporter [Candidatus Woesearchaeota archaeon]|nr:cation:proton antiporter [Candidatus Woesearchaeota archaeon]
MFEDVLSFVPQSLLFNLGVILIVATFFAYIARLFKQPLIPAYIIAGLVIGPIGLKLIQDTNLIQSISEIGIIFLLFIVGLEMDLKKLKSLGGVVAITGILQVFLTFAAGYFVALLMGFDTMNAIYAGLIIAFSSTMIVLKLIIDKDELSTIHGRMLLGILFIQDILVILALTLIIGSDSLSFTAILYSLLKFLILLVIAFIANRYLIHPTFKFAAKSSELLFLLSLAFCFLFSLLAYALDFSIAIGAFFGGITLANLPYNLNIISKVSSLKDFFAIIFFVSLGLQIVSTNISSIITPFFVFLALVILLKPLIVMILLSIFGYDKRNSFVTAVSLAQISEFGLILVLSVDNISPELFSVTILLGVISIALTSYIVEYELKTYNFIHRFLSIFEKLSTKKKFFGYEHKDRPELILFGADRVGGTFLRTFKHLKTKLFVVDYNPEIIDTLKHKKTPCLYGDISNLELLKRVDFTSAKFIVSTIPCIEDNKTLILFIKELNLKPTIILTAKTSNEAIDLYNLGADYVLVPYVKSGEILSSLLDKYYNDHKGLQKIRQTHLRLLLDKKKS